MWPDDMISNGWLWRTPVSKAPISLWWIYGRWAFSWNWRRHKFVISCIMDVMAELEKTHTDFHFIMAWVSVWDIDDGGSFLPDVDAYSLFEWILSWDRWAWMCGLQTFFLHHGSHFSCRAFCDGGWWKVLVFTSKMSPTTCCDTEN